MPGVSNAPPAGRPASPPDAGAAGRLRVVLAEDDVLLREGVASLLDQAGFEVAGQAGDADGLLALVRETRPDLVVVDIRMPPTRTTEGLDRKSTRLNSSHPSISYAVFCLKKK